jgi:hypothetical protein
MSTSSSTSSTDKQKKTREEANREKFSKALIAGVKPKSKAERKRIVLRGC